GSAVKTIEQSMDIIPNGPVQTILSRLEGVKQTGKGKWIARCPAHDDHTPSLSIAVGDDGRALLYCFAGCSLKEIVTALGSQMADLSAQATGRSCEAKESATNKPRSPGSFPSWQAAMMSLCASKPARKLHFKTSQDLVAELCLLNMVGTSS